MPTISPYTEGVIVPQYKTTDYNNELELQLLMKKQSEYNTVVSRLGNLRSTSLNISMLNVPGKKKLDAYNAELKDMLSQDLGDLTDPKVQSKVANFFTKVSTDTDLKQRSKLSRHYQDQLDMIQNMRESKDPVKSGYNAINETVFRKWTGGLEDFMFAEDVNNWDLKKQSYTPFKDIDQKLVNLTKLLHADSQLTQKPLTTKVTIDGKEVDVPTGYDILESTKGVSSARIRNLLQSSLDADELAQFDVLSKYRIIQSSATPEGKLGMYQSYNSFISREARNTKNQLAVVQALKKQLDPKNIDSKLTDDEKTIKKATYQAELDKLNEQEQYLLGATAKQIKDTISEEEWMKMDNNEMLPYINQLTVESYVNGISDSLAWKEEAMKYGMDETNFANRRMNNMEARLALDAELGRAALKLKQMELDGKLSSTSPATPADIIKSEVSLFTQWEDVTNFTKAFNDKITPIVSGKDNKGNYQIDPKNLTNNKWLEQNKDNYDVKLWNVYVSKYRNRGAFLDKDFTNPNLDGFTLFKKQVENGDFKNDSSINEIMSQYSKDKETGEWLNNTVAKVANTINNTADIGSVRVGDHSLRDYAEQHGWNGQGEMTFGVKDGKGGYKHMTWTEVKNEYNKSFSNLITPAMSNSPFQAVKDIWEDMSKMDVRNLFKSSNSILKNDPAFFALVGKAIEQEQKSTEMIKEIYTEQLPQFLQGQHEIHTDDKFVVSQLGYLNSATKLAGEDYSMALSDKDVEQVAIPVGIGKYGYFSLTDSGAKRHEGHKLVDVSGKPVTPVAGQWYRYDPPLKDPYDIMMNAKFKDTGFVQRNIQGYNVEINDEKNGKMRVIIDGNGEYKDFSIPAKDVSLVLKEVEGSINSLNKK